MMSIKTASGLISIVPLLLLSACSATSDTTRFYTLKPINDFDLQSNITKKTQSMSLETLKIPRLLDRPQIVSRIGTNEIKRADYHQWGGSVVEEIEQLIGRNINRRLADSALYLLPSVSRQQADYNLHLHIHRLDGELGDKATIEMTWQLESGESQNISNRGFIRHTTLLTSADYSAYVIALRTLLEQSIVSLSDQLKNRSRRN